VTETPGESPAEDLAEQQTEEVPLDEDERG
jgi:hypothetical protein